MNKSIKSYLALAGTFTIKEAPRWLATIGVTDGVVTPSERLLL